MHSKFPPVLKMIALVSVLFLLSLACYSNEPSQGVPTQRSTSRPQIVPTFKAETAPGTLAKEYTYHRKYPNEKSETGMLFISTSGQGYDLIWDGPLGEETGIGLLSNSILIAALGSDCGITFYNRYPAGNLSGMWLERGVPAGLETAWPVRTSNGQSFSGEYQVEGENGDGSKYGGSLKISKKNQIYSLNWEIGSDIFEGIGLAQNNQLGSAYSASSCKIFLYNLHSDGKLSGVFASTDNDLTGTENALPK